MNRSFLLERDTPKKARLEWCSSSKRKQNKPAEKEREWKWWEGKNHQPHCSEAATLLLTGSAGQDLLQVLLGNLRWKEKKVSKRAQVSKRSRLPDSDIII